ncbi:hypothetical protein FVE85_3561 [Porphyridium purpureum]|uniref:PDZ domain-containing protein n=1 Tax=Porphyridium purpureum TaxID=35688 RepID=A0A5J4YN79_PORPP|nr:hypothetical protein FVE85_3561 [Porphyridium purpureum]|eukprot:POR9088..scf249_10
MAAFIGGALGVGKGSALFGRGKVQDGRSVQRQAVATGKSGVVAGRRCAAGWRMMASSADAKKASRLVKVKKPLGLALEEVASGAVVVSGFRDGGMAAASGLLVGEVVVGVREVATGTRWETRRVGLERVMAIIKSIETDEVEFAVEPAAAAAAGADSGFTQKKIDPQLRNRLKQEYSAPYRQNWILTIIAVITVLVLAAYASGIRP